ncbi:MAG: hypothetical protein KJ077_49470 [Anaerolineae bacterium]|nr:hypothetical protein [Anaerolineae bacterium]
MIKRHFDLLTVFVLPVLLLGLAGCAINEGAMQRLAPTPQAAQVELALAPQSALPGYAQEAEPRVRDAYRFAVANPDVMTKIPCYCGCGTMGHENALDCFVKDVQPNNGSIEFDNHAAGCGICVDITQDVMRLMRQDQPLKAIRAYVDAEYSQFAAPTNTPAIE